MNSLFQINPKGYYLKDFCYVNLYSFDNEVELLKGNFLEKIQYYFIKKKVEKIISIISKEIYYKECLDFNLLQSKLIAKDDNAWDYLLYNIAIKEISILAPISNSITLNDKYNTILSSYLKEVKNYLDKDYEIFKLEVKKIGLYAEVQLIQASPELKNNRGQFFIYKNQL